MKSLSQLLGNAFTAAALLVASSFGALGASNFVSPPYSDSELVSDFADAWEPEATFASLGLLVLASFAITLLAWAKFGPPSGRNTKVLAAAVSFSSSAIVLAAHIALTHRVTALTGQSFGRFWGLF